MSTKAGPGNPPIRNRFRKGQSGNPRGRPKGSSRKKSESAFDLVIDRTLTVSQDGRQRELTVEEALQYKTWQDALSGNRTARRELLKMIARREKALAGVGAVTLPAPAVRVDKNDPTNVNDALTILDIARPCGRDQLLLEPWAVQMALTRRRGGARLTGEEVKDIKECTRAPETLRWPRGTAS